MYNYLVENQFEYLCEVNAKSKRAKFYADKTNKIIYTKTQLCDKICAEANMT